MVNMYKEEQEILKQNKKLMVIWGVACAEHVLNLFEKNHPSDKNPRKTLETAKLWVKYSSDKENKIKLKEIRASSLSSHASARNSNIPEARCSARSAGQAVAACHATLHAIGAAYYALKAIKYYSKANKQEIEKERTFQLNKLPKQFRDFKIIKYYLDKV